MTFKHVVHRVHETVRCPALGCRRSMPCQGGNQNYTSDDKRRRAHSRSQRSVGSVHDVSGCGMSSAATFALIGLIAPCSIAACCRRWPIEAAIVDIHQSANERFRARSRHATLATERRQILVHAEQGQRVVALRPSVETTWTRPRPLTWRFQPQRAMLKPDGGEMRSALMCR